MGFESGIDPCNPSVISSVCAIVSLILFFLQKSDFCMPVLDYIKITAIIVIMYFYYQVVIKLKPALCGVKGASMWSCVCLSMLIAGGALAALCVRFRDPSTGKASPVAVAGGYAGLIFCLLPCTILCIFRLYHNGGPMDKDFWNPSTMFKVYI